MLREIYFTNNTLSFLENNKQLICPIMKEIKHDCVLIMRQLTKQTAVTNTLHHFQPRTQHCAFSNELVVIFKPIKRRKKQTKVRHWLNHLLHLPCSSSAPVDTVRGERNGWFYFGPTMLVLFEAISQMHRSGIN